MRLHSLELSGFRGFAKSQPFDLDADAVIVVGQNGQGKTSLFDGILWALTGLVPRLKTTGDAEVVSKYSDTGQARAVLRLKDERTNNICVVTRSFDGTDKKLALETSEGKFQGTSAEGRLIDLIWSDAASASDPADALASVLTESIYLQQDSIRHFVEAASDDERFAAVSELVGAGRVTELQNSLERAKRSWSTATNQLASELDVPRDRLAAVEARLSELTQRSFQVRSETGSQRWEGWWQSMIGVGVTIAPVQAGSAEAPKAIDDAMKQLEALRRSTERRLEALGSARQALSNIAKEPIAEVQPLKERADLLQNELAEKRRLVSEEQARLANERRLQAALREQNEQVRALATLALKTLGERCPICDQEYDKNATKQRLEAIVRRGGRTQFSSEPEKLAELLVALEEKEKELSAATLSLRSAEQARNERETGLRSLTTRLVDLGITTPDDAGRQVAIDAGIRQAEELLGRIAELQRTGESLALLSADSSTMATIDELRRETETLHRKIAETERDVDARNETGELAQHIIEALREASSAVVQERLHEIEHLVQGVYARMDPHPTFRMVKFFSRFTRGKGRLGTVVSDPAAKVESSSPHVVLSSSQINALGVSVFLALNLGAGRAPLSVAMLDDPLQSLDDINLLGLVDLLRRIMARRQLLVSTHDPRFGSLLARKLRPDRQDGLTKLLELDGWRRNGPHVVVRDIRSDPAPLRLVARAG